MPNRNELLSLIDVKCFGPALSSASGKSKWVSGDAFVGVQSHGYYSPYYWSSTTYSSGATYKWGVTLNNGGVNNCHKDDAWYVWPVRAGQ